MLYYRNKTTLSSKGTSVNPIQNKHMEKENDSLIEKHPLHVKEQPQVKKYAPLILALHRRLETGVVLFHVSSIFVFSIVTLYVFASPFLLFVVFAPYFIYFFCDKTPANGNVDRFFFLNFRKWIIWKWYCDYFPIKLHKTSDLKPTFTLENDYRGENIDQKEEYGPNYIFGYHPHGICALGGFGGIATNGANFDQFFPGIKVSLLTLVNNFQLPFYREYILASGLSSVSRKNALKLLQKKISVCIVLGGASEALHAGVGNADLILLKRKGFVKLALEVGNVGLVPVFAFGENDIFTVVEVSEGSFLKKIQLWFKARVGFTVPIFFGRGIFNYDWGFVPFRKPINLVFGKPIMVPKIENYTKDDINHYHGLYVKELENIFEENKMKFGYGDLSINYIA